MTRREVHEATLEDVARVAGVSRATASRVLGGYGAASENARRRVTEAAEALGYAPNAVARALVTGAGVRLVVAVSGLSPAILQDPYVDRVLGAAAAVCAPQGLGVSLHWLPVHAPGELRRLADDRSVRGVLVLNTTEQLLAAVPATLRGRVASIGIGSRAVPAFDVDNGGAATAVVQHLLATGRRRVAMVTGPHWMPCARRSVDAYRETVRAADLPVRLVAGDFTAASGRTAAREVLRRWPDTDAVFAISDATALGALSELRRHGADVPGDIAVAGFDDIPFAALSAPALTTASHPVDRIATAAVRAILNGRAAAPVTVFGSELIRRESA